MNAEEYFASIGLVCPVIQTIAGVGVVLVLEGVRRRWCHGWAFAAVGIGQTEREATKAIIEVIAGRKLLVPRQMIRQGHLRHNARTKNIAGKQYVEFRVPDFVPKEEEVPTNARSTEEAVLVA